MKRTRSIALAAASALALGACMHSPEQLARANHLNTQMTAREVTAELKIGTGTAGDKLAPDARDAVKYFAAAYANEGHGALIISRPANGADDISAIRAAADARAVMLANGVEPNAIVEGPYDATGARNAPLLLTYKTWEAVVPNCPDISHYDLSNTSSNDAAPSFGCALAVNIAKMIANPGDLVGKQQVDPADAARREIMLSKYRNGEITGAAKSEEASGAISKAVK